jgi:MFS family permease
MTRKMTFALLMGLTLGLVFLTIPPVLTPLMALYRVSYVKISLLISALLWSHALMQIPAGVITDRLGLRRALVLCLGAMTAGGLVPAVSPSLGAAVGGRVLTGVGTGLAFVTVMKLIALEAPGGRIGTYQAFFAGAFSLGSILAFLAMPRIITFGWSWVYLAPSITCLPLLVLLAFLGLPPTDPHLTQAWPLGQVLRIRTGWVIGCYHALSFGAMLNLGNWVPSLLAEVRPGSTATQLAWGGALVMLVSGLGRLCGGFILLRVRPLRIANGSLLILSIVFLGLCLVRTPWMMALAALLAAWFASVNFGALFHMASRVTPAGSLASFFGFINLLANLGAVVFTLMFGWVKDTFGTLGIGFGILALLAWGVLLLGAPVLRFESSNSRLF